MKAMIKTIDFAGIALDNYSVRETIMNVEKNMFDQGFHTNLIIIYNIRRIYYGNL